MVSARLPREKAQRRPVRTFKSDCPDVLHDLLLFVTYARLCSGDLLNELSNN